MQIFTRDFAKEWVKYALNPIALASTAIAKESLFCNAIANAQCERNLTLTFILSLEVITEFR